MTRLPEQPGERIARDRVIRFTFDGKAIEGDLVPYAAPGGRVVVDCEV